MSKLESRQASEPPSLGPECQTRSPLDAPAHGGKTLEPRKQARNCGIVAPEAILKTFNTWAFKREQPDNAESLETAIRKAVSKEEPVPFVLYWGKGPRGGRAEPDAQCLRYLKSFASRIEERYPRGAEITLILTDTHANLNGHARESILAYFSDIAIAARTQGFHTCRLSRLVAALPDSSSSEDAPDAELLSKLSASAAKWYCGKETPEMAALRYYRMNMVERRAVEHAFPDAIFATFNGSSMRPLFPLGMPIFYMYSLKKGMSVKPWFLPGDATRGTAGAKATEPAYAPA